MPKFDWLYRRRGSEHQGLQKQLVDFRSAARSG